MNSVNFEPGTYVVINSDGANIRREPRIISSPSNVVGKHTFSTQLEVYEVLVDANMMVWGRISQIEPSAGKANWICIHTGNRQILKPVESVKNTDNTNSGTKTLKVMIDDIVIFTTKI